MFEYAGQYKVSVNKCIIKQSMRARKSIKWYDDFSAADAFAAATDIYNEQKYMAEGIAKDALQNYKTLSESVIVNTSKGYIKQFGRAIMKEIDNAQHIPEEDLQEYCEKLSYYFVLYCKFVVYITDPASRTVSDNPDRDIAIAELQYKRTRKIKTLAIMIIPISALTLWFILQ